MTQVQTKMEKTSKTISVFVKVVEVIAIVGTVLVGAIFAGCLLGAPELAEAMAGAYPNAQNAAVLLPIALGVVAALLGVTAAACEALHRMFKQISLGGTPFAAANVARIKTVAWLAVVISVLAGTAGNIEDAMLTGKAMVLVNIEGLWLVFGGIIYCLACIFDYGCQLQQLSDETL